MVMFVLCLGIIFLVVSPTEILCEGELVVWGEYGTLGTSFNET